MSNVPMNPIDDKNHKDDEIIAYEHRMVQAVANAMWAVATSNNHAIASYRSEAYRNMEIVFFSVLKETYHLTDAQIKSVRDNLSEYGPDDSLRGTTGRGVESYVEFAINNTLPKGWRKMSSDALEELTDKLYDNSATKTIYEELNRREEEGETLDIPRDQLDYEHNAPIQY